MIGMGKRDLSRNASDEIARLGHFLSFASSVLEVEQGTLAEQVGITSSAISKALQRGVGVAMREKFHEWGLDRRYWKSPEWRNAANFVRQGQRASEGAVVLERVVALARRRHLPNEQIGKLVTMEPPADRRTDPWWWFDRLTELETEAAGPVSTRATRKPTG